MDNQQMLANAKHLSCLLCRMTGCPRVLIVDDMEADRLWLRRLLNEFQCEIEDCGTGEEAVKLIEERSFDIVFIDLVLPTMSSDEVISLFTQKKPGVHFVLVTGHPEAPVLSRALKSGAKLVFDKPLKAETLALFFRPRNHEPT